MANVRKVPFEPDSAALYYSTMCTCESLHVCDIKATQMYTQGISAYSHAWKYVYLPMGANVYVRGCRGMHTHTHVCVGVLP